MTEIVLFLGPREKTEALAPAILSAGDQPILIEQDEKLTPEFVWNTGATFLVSYGYRHIIAPHILAQFPDRAINLHISYLPWNRGADPNFWSFVDDTPKGVSIHYLDEGIDTGDILAQKRVYFDDPHETLKTSYQKLCNEIEAMFGRHWRSIRSGNCNPRPQRPEDGTFHYHKEIQGLELPQGWDTPVSYL